MFVGESGVSRVIQRTCEAMNAAGIEDPFDIERVRALGVIDLPTLQKKANLHYSLSLDLFGSEISTNAANAFNSGLKGRYRETRIEDDHRLLEATYPVLRLVDGEAKWVNEPALTALNMRLRDDYVVSANKGVERWNKVIARSGIDFSLRLPSVAFHRQIGEFRSVFANPEGELVSEEAFQAARYQWLPSTADGEFVASLMEPCHDIGQYAGWIAAPAKGIDNRPGDFEYVQLAEA